MSFKTLIALVVLFSVVIFPSQPSFAGWGEDLLKKGVDKLNKKADDSMEKNKVKKDAESLYKQREYTKALKSVDKALSIDSSDQELIELKANIVEDAINQELEFSKKYLDKKDYNNARRHVKKALKFDDSSKSAIDLSIEIDNVEKAEIERIEAERKAEEERIRKEKKAERERIEKEEKAEEEILSKKRRAEIEEREMKRLAKEKQEAKESKERSDRKKKLWDSYGGTAKPIKVSKTYYKLEKTMNDDIVKYVKKSDREVVLKQIAYNRKHNPKIVELLEATIPDMTSLKFKVVKMTASTAKVQVYGTFHFKTPEGTFSYSANGTYIYLVKEAGIWVVSVSGN